MGGNGGGRGVQAPGGTGLGWAADDTLSGSSITLPSSPASQRTPSSQTPYDDLLPPTSASGPGSAPGSTPSALLATRRRKAWSEGLATCSGTSRSRGPAQGGKGMGPWGRASQAWDTVAGPDSVCGRPPDGRREEEAERHAQRPARPRGHAAGCVAPSRGRTPPRSERLTLLQGPGPDQIQGGLGGAQPRLPLRPVESGEPEVAHVLGKGQDVE